MKEGSCNHNWGDWTKNVGGTFFRHCDKCMEYNEKDSSASIFSIGLVLICSQLVVLLCVVVYHT